MIALQNEVDNLGIDPRFLLSVGGEQRVVADLIDQTRHPARRMIDALDRLSAEELCVLAGGDRETMSNVLARLDRFLLMLVQRRL